MNRNSCYRSQLKPLLCPCAVASEDLQVGEVLDVRRGAGHGEQSGQVGVGCVGGKTQGSALEMNSGLAPETFIVIVDTREKGMTNNKCLIGSQTSQEKRTSLFNFSDVNKNVHHIVLCVINNANIIVL